MVGNKIRHLLFGLLTPCCRKHKWAQRILRSAIPSVSTMKYAGNLSFPEHTRLYGLSCYSEGLQSLLMGGIWSRASALISNSSFLELGPIDPLRLVYSNKEYWVVWFLFSFVIGRKGKSKNRTLKINREKKSRAKSWKYNGKFLYSEYY